MTIKKLAPILLSSILLTGCFGSATPDKNAVVKTNQLNQTLAQESEKLREKLATQSDIISKYEKKTLENTTIDINNIEYSSKKDLIQKLDGRVSLLTTNIPKNILESVYESMYPKTTLTLDFYATYLNSKNLINLYNLETVGLSSYGKKLAANYSKDASKLNSIIKDYEKELTAVMNVVDTPSYAKKIKKEQREISINNALKTLPAYIETKENEDRENYRTELKVYKKKMITYEAEVAAQKTGDPQPTAPEKPTKPIPLDITQFTDTELKKYAEKSLSKEQLELDSLNLELLKKTEYLVGLELYLTMRELLTIGNAYYKELEMKEAHDINNTYLLRGITNSFDENKSLSLAAHVTFLELLQYNHIKTSSTAKELPIHLINLYLSDATYKQTKDYLNRTVSSNLSKKSQKELTHVYYLQKENQLKLENATMLLREYLPETTKMTFTEYRISQASNLLDAYTMLDASFTHDDTTKKIGFPTLKSFKLNTDFNEVKRNLILLDKVYPDTLATYKKKINYTKRKSTKDTSASANLYTELQRAVTSTKENTPNANTEKSIENNVNTESSSD